MCSQSVTEPALPGLSNFNKLDEFNKPTLNNLKLNLNNIGGYTKRKISFLNKKYTTKKYKTKTKKLKNITNHTRKIKKTKNKKQKIKT